MIQFFFIGNLLTVLWQLDNCVKEIIKNLTKYPNIKKILYLTSLKNLKTILISYTYIRMYMIFF